MSLAATLINPPGAFKTGRVLKAFYRLVFSNNYATNGETCDLRAKGLAGNKVPISVDIKGQSGFTYPYVPGTNLGDGKVQIRVATTTGANLPLAQHSAAAVDAAVIADVIIAEVTYPAA